MSVAVRTPARKMQGKSRRSAVTRRWWKAYIFLLPSLAGTSVFLLVPYLDVVRRSFCQAVGGKFVGLLNYRTVLANEMFRLAAANTVHFLVVCIPLLVVLSLLLAVLITGLGKRGEIYKTSFLIPLAIPAASVVFLWQILFHRYGIVNEAIGLAGLEGRDWMNGDTAFGVLVFTYLWKNTGYDMVLWLAGLSGIAAELYEAAKVDGAGVLARFRYITLPGLKRTALLVAALSLFNSFKVFREAYLISGDYPHESIYMLQHLFNNWFTALDIQKMSAASVLLLIVFAVPLAGYLFARRKAM